MHDENKGMDGCIWNMDEFTDAEVDGFIVGWVGWICRTSGWGLDICSPGSLPRIPRMLHQWVAFGAPSVRVCSWSIAAHRLPTDDRLPLQLQIRLEGMQRAMAKAGHHREDQQEWCQSRSAEQARMLSEMAGNKLDPLFFIDVGCRQKC